MYYTIIYLCRVLDPYIYFFYVDPAFAPCNADPDSDLDIDIKKINKRFCDRCTRMLNLVNCLLHNEKRAWSIFFYIFFILEGLARLPEADLDPWGENNANRDRSGYQALVCGPGYQALVCRSGGVTKHWFVDPDTKHWFVNPDTSNWFAEPETKNLFVDPDT